MSNFRLICYHSQIKEKGEILGSPYNPHELHDRYIEHTPSPKKFSPARETRFWRLHAKGFRNDAFPSDADWRYRGSSEDSFQQTGRDLLYLK